jgi:DNA-binding transcriptional ArsR family regulator
MAPSADNLLDALADPTRRRVVQLLGERPYRAGELARAIGTSAPVMSRHLRTLHQAGFLDDARGETDARQRIFRLRQDSVIALQAWLDQLQAQWSEQLSSYARHLNETHRPDPDQPTTPPSDEEPRP